MNFNLTSFLSAVFIIILGYFFLRRLPKLIERIFDTVPGFKKVDKTFAYFISDSVGIFVLVTLAIYGFTLLPESATVLAMLITVASGAFIFTSEGWVQDAFAGISLQLYPQYKVGDKVTLSGKTGRVARVGLFRTDVKTRQLDLISLKNSKILSQDLINHSALDMRELTAELNVLFYGDYERDITQFKKDLANTAKEIQDQFCPEAFQVFKRTPKIFLMGFDGTHDKYHIVYYIHDKQDFRAGYDLMYSAIFDQMTAKKVALGHYLTPESYLVISDTVKIKTVTD